MSGERLGTSTTVSDAHPVAITFEVPDGPGTYSVRIAIRWSDDSKVAIVSLTVTEDHEVVWVVPGGRLDM